MRISVEIELRHNADPVAVQQWLQWGRELDKGPQSLLSELRAGQKEPLVPVPETLTEAEPPQGDDSDLPEEVVPPPSAAVPPGVTAGPRPRGRPRRNPATTEQQVAALEASAAEASPPPPVQAPASAPTPSFAAPPGVAPPQPVAAMPPVQPAPPPVNGAVMAMDDFRTALFELQTEAQNAGKQIAIPFNVMRTAGVWPDGSPKSWSTMMADKVPPEERTKLIEQCQMALAR